MNIQNLSMQMRSTVHQQGERGSFCFHLDRFILFKRGTTFSALICYARHGPQEAHLIKQRQIHEWEILDLSHHYFVLLPGVATTLRKWGGQEVKLIAKRHNLYFSNRFCLGINADQRTVGWTLTGFKCLCSNGGRKIIFKSPLLAQNGLLISFLARRKSPSCFQPYTYIKNFSSFITVSII